MESYTPAVLQSDLDTGRKKVCVHNNAARCPAWPVRAFELVSAWIGGLLDWTLVLMRPITGHLRRCPPRLTNHDDRNGSGPSRQPCFQVTVRRSSRVIASLSSMGSQERSGGRPLCALGAVIMIHAASGPANNSPPTVHRGTATHTAPLLVTRSDPASSSRSV